MSKENLNKFFEELNSNSDLKEQFENFLTNLNNLSKDEKKEKLTEFITKQGYAIDKSDLKLKHEDSKEFSEDEMENVAGGGILSSLGQGYASGYCGGPAGKVVEIIV